MLLRGKLRHLFSPHRRQRSNRADIARSARRGLDLWWQLANLNPMRHSLVIPITFLTLVLTAVALPASGQQPKDSLDRDYAGELPRIPAKEPDQALKTLHVAPG